MIQLLESKGADLSHKTADDGTAVMGAAEGGHTEVAAYLIGKGVSAGAADSVNGDTPMSLAVISGHLEMVELLAKEGADLQVEDADGNTPLLFAANAGRLAILKFLMQHGADVTHANAENRNALHYSCEAAHHPCTELLLTSPIDVSLQDAENNTPLHLACKSTSTAPIVSSILSRSNLILNSRNDKNETPIICAMKSDCYDLISCLVSAGADIEARDKEGNSAVLLAGMKGLTTVLSIFAKQQGSSTAKVLSEALIPAALSGHLPTVKALIEEHNVPATYIDANDASTAAQPAAIRGDLPMLQYVHTQGTDVLSHQNSSGMTALMFAALKGHVNVVSWLLGIAVANNSVRDTVNITSATGETALMHSAFNGHKECAVLLLEYSDVDHANEDRFTALMVASQNGLGGVVGVLLAKGAGVDAQNVEGRTALMFASHQGSVEVVAQLLAAKAVVDACDDGKVTPLAAAVMGGHEDVAKLLLDAGASPSFADVNGATPLMPACSLGSLSLVQHMLHHKADVHAKDLGNDDVLSYATSREAKTKSAIEEKEAIIAAIKTALSQ